MFAQEVLVGIILGVIFGMLAVKFISQMFNDELMVTTMTIITSYLVFLFI
jgi:hypothetical protein